MPGPACYGRGGTLPTITDCNLVLGQPVRGQLPRRPHAARQGQGRAQRIETAVAKPLGLDVMEAAEGIVRIINVKMEEAIKAISTIRGHDLREFMLLPFGGAGPIHAGAIADSLRHGRARGAALSRRVLRDRPADVGRQARLHPLAHDALCLCHPPTSVDAVFASAGDAGEGRPRRRRLSTPTASASQRALDLRYAGQGYEITIPCGAIADRRGARPRCARAFDATHKQQFGHAAPDEVVEIVSWRVQSTGLVPPVETRALQAGRPQAGGCAARAPPGALRRRDRSTARSTSASASTSATRSPAPR